MHMNDVVISLVQNIPKEVFTNRTCPDFGVFHIYGGTERKQNLVHSILIPDLVNVGHILKVNVGKGLMGRFSIENASDITRPLNFSYKHSGLSRKNLKPGVILTAPETYLLSWESVTKENIPVIVTLTIAPLISVHGLRLLYSLQSK